MARGFSFLFFCDLLLIWNRSLMTSVSALTMAPPAIALLFDDTDF